MHIFSQHIFNKVLAGLALNFLFNAVQAQAPPALPNPFPGTTPLNNVKSWVARYPVTDYKQVIDANKTSKEVLQTTQYIDGVGRPLQMVIKQGSQVSGQSATDLVTPVTYDNAGRQTYKYLFFPSAATNGAFKYDPLQQQAAFYNSHLAGQTGETNVGGGNLNWAYEKTNYEASPLNRVTGVFNAGSSWAGSEGSAAEKKMAFVYSANTAIDEVRIWMVNDDPNDELGAYVTTSIYPEKELRITIATDENGAQTIEFVDNQGSLILKKVQLTANADNGTGSDHMGWLCTYYIYDDFNQLRGIIQPEGVNALISGNWTATPNLLNEQCFRYTYDGRRRLIMKKVPGAGTVYMVYDMHDRLVFSQDANMRTANQWQTTLYDEQSRLVITGLITYTATQSGLQDVVDKKYTTAPPPPVGIPVDLVLPEASHIGSYSGDYVATNSIALQDGFETTAGAAFSASINNTGVDPQDPVDQQPVNSNPIPSGAPFTVLTTHYYDDYSAINNIIPGFGSKDNSYDKYFAAASNTAWPYPQSLTATDKTKNLVTATKTRVLNVPGDQYLYTAAFYDDEGRMIQTKSTNLSGASHHDVITIQYSYSGQPLMTVQAQHQGSGTNAQTTLALSQLTYDNLGRLVKTERKTANGIDEDHITLPAEWNTNVTLTYNALGQMKTKNLGLQKDAPQHYTTTPITTLNYDYNIRGWLQGINKNYVGTGSATSAYFGMELNYDKDGYDVNRNKQYDGGIGAMIWRSRGDGVNREYQYAFDNAGRLLKADFTQQEGSAWSNSTMNFNVVMGSNGTSGPTGSDAYDANGNIKRMQQWGYKTGGSAQIDDLVYSYYNNGNKLQAITDNAAGGTSPTGPATASLGDFTDKNTTATDYGYDKNGNMVIDLNKRIRGTTGPGLDMAAADGAIRYNHMNLPEHITITGENNTSKGSIDYVYDALGNKLQKIIKENNANVSYNGQHYTSNVTTTINYVGGFVYESKEYDIASVAALNYANKLQFGEHEEGRMRYTTPALGQTGGNFEYDYYLKDHLGNVRMVLTDEYKTDIYPAATLEGDMANSADAVYNEKSFYNIDPNNVVLKNIATGITDYINKNGGPAELDQPVNNNPNGSATALSEKLYMLDASDGIAKTGLGITLKVMSGDRIDIFGKSYYFNNNTSGNNYQVPVLDVLSGLLGAPTGATAGKVVTAPGLNGITDIHSAVSNFLANPGRDNEAVTVPKAYINPNG